MCSHGFFETCQGSNLPHAVHTLPHPHTWKGTLGICSLSFSRRLQGHSCRKRRDTSKVAPPHISREPALASTWAMAGAALSMSWVRMRVASRDCTAHGAERKEGADELGGGKGG